LEAQLRRARGIVAQDLHGIGRATVGVQSGAGSGPRVSTQKGWKTGLLRGVTVQVDADQVGTIGFGRCNVGGCVTAGPLPDTVAAKLKSGKVFWVTIYHTKEQGIGFPFQLDGLSSVLDKIAEMMQAEDIN
jgi:Invasion associated locus B (IalB) protein